MAIGPMNPQRVVAGSEFDLRGCWGHVALPGFRIQDLADSRQLIAYSRSVQPSQFSFQNLRLSHCLLLTADCLLFDCYLLFTLQRSNSYLVSQRGRDFLKRFAVDG